ncbi:hypothetical protein Val02_65730 [Virgisporangium aliadipatigenens]|uniref:Peptidase S8/S53 domain-containing protein n=1 Tax=Virgisporangium aliadipatigenens TaxID=741659 RepID=A0A8J3YSI7_9ACTN|nr:hypothetical protein Val02_65730 [Virgisporangium aliadipatigenens]
MLLPVPATAAPTEQWHLAALRIPEAHQITSGTGVVVAVIDSGVRPHPDLDGQVLAGTDISDKDPSEDNGHGTVCAALIAGRGPAPGKILGIAPGAKILPVRIGNDGGGVAFLRHDEAVRWAVDHGAKVINMSIGVIGRGEATLADAVAYALDHDVVVVASSGNKGADLDEIPAPANVPGVIAVGATGRDGNLWDGTVTGPELTLTAPGVDLPGAYPTDPGKPARYTTIPGGTSASAPIVAGAAALVRAKYPQLSANDVIQRLISTADDAGEPGRDDEYGYGRLNIVKALTADVEPVTENPLGEPERTSDVAIPAPEEERDVTGALLFVAGLFGVFLLLMIGLVVFLFWINRRASLQR